MAEYAVSKIAYEDDTFKLKDYRNAGVYYGTCATAAATQAKAVTCANFTLATGAIIFVKFTYGQSYNGAPTLNVNSAGAKSVKSVGTTNSVRYAWLAGEVVGFVYDGTNFIILDGGIASTTYYGVTKLSSETNSTSTTLAATPSAVKAAYDLAATANNKVPTPTASDVGKVLMVNANGQYYLGTPSSGTQHTVTVVLDGLSSPTALYVQYGTTVIEDDAVFSVSDGDTIHCYAWFSAADNKVYLNGTVVSNDSPAEYDYIVHGDVTITISGSPGDYGHIFIVED